MTESQVHACIIIYFFSKPVDLIVLLAGGFFSSLRTKAETERVILGTSYNPHSRRPKTPSLTKHHNGFLRWGSNNTPLLKKWGTWTNCWQKSDGKTVSASDCLDRKSSPSLPLRPLRQQESWARLACPMGPASFRCLAWRSSSCHLNGADKAMKYLLFSQPA